MPNHTRTEPAMANDTAPGRLGAAPPSSSTASTPWERAAALVLQHPGMTLAELVRAATGRAGDPHDQLRHRLRHQLPAARAARAVVCGDQRRCTVLGADTQTWWPSEALCGQPAPRRLRRLGRGSTAEAA